MSLHDRKRIARILFADYTSDVKKNWLVFLALCSVPVGASPFGLSVEVQSAQFRCGQGAAVFQVHGPHGGHLQAAILDNNDNLVAVPVSVDQEHVLWDGRNQQGQLVRPGTYFVQIVEEPYLWDSAVVVEP